MYIPIISNRVKFNMDGTVIAACGLLVIVLALHLHSVNSNVLADNQLFKMPRYQRSVDFNYAAFTHFSTSVNRLFTERPSWFMYDDRFARHLLYVWNSKTKTWNKHRLLSGDAFSFRWALRRMKPAHHLPVWVRQPFFLQNLPVYRYH